jgi:hypothetical protein
MFHHPHARILVKSIIDLYKVKDSRIGSKGRLPRNLEVSPTPSSNKILCH